MQLDIMKKVIIKVQVALFTSDRSSSCLVYDKSNKFWHEGPITPWLKKLMRGELKKFFYAEISGGNFNIIKEAPWQDW